MATNKKPGKWRRRTQAVRGGQVRTGFQETCEPLLFTAGYAYEAAEEAEARFKGESPGYQCVAASQIRPSPCSKSAWRCWKARPSLAPPPPAWPPSVPCFLAGLKTGDHVVSANALFGSCRYVMENVLPRFGITCTFVEGSDLDAWQAAMTPTDAAAVPGNPIQSDPGDRRHRGGGQDRGQAPARA